MKISLFSETLYLCDLTQLSGPNFVTGKITFHAPIFDMKKTLLNIRLGNGKVYLIDRVTKGFSRDTITEDTYNAQLGVENTLVCSMCSHMLQKHSRHHEYPDRGVTLLECVECDCINFKD